MSDDRLERALEFSNYVATMSNQKENIKNRVAQLQLVHYNGGTFKADPTTISFIKTLMDLGHTDAILFDSKQNPVNVKNLKTLLEDLVSAYFSAAQEFDVEYSKMRKARSIKKIMDW